MENKHIGGLYYPGEEIQLWSGKVVRILSLRLDDKRYKCNDGVTYEDKDIEGRFISTKELNNVYRYGEHEEVVNHPEHYNKGKIEAIDVIEDWKLGFHLGNVVKYIARAESKGKKEENIKKCIWYLERELENNRGNI